MTAQKNKQPVNLFINGKVIMLCQAYAESNGKKLSNLVEEVLVRFLEAEGFPVKAPTEEVMKIYTARLAEEAGEPLPFQEAPPAHRAVKYSSTRKSSK